MKMYLLHNWVR